MRIPRPWVQVLRAESGEWVHTLPDGVVERHVFSIARLNSGGLTATQVILGRWAVYFGWL